MFRHTPAATEQRCSRQFLFQKFCLLTLEHFSLCVCMCVLHAHMHTEARPRCWVSTCITLHVIFLIRCVTELKTHQPLLRGWLTREHSRCACLCSQVLWLARCTAMLASLVGDGFEFRLSRLPAPPPASFWSQSVCLDKPCFLVWKVTVSPLRGGSTVEHTAFSTTKTGWSSHGPWAACGEACEVLGLVCSWCVADSYLLL